MTVYNLFSYIGLVALAITLVRFFLQDYRNVFLSFMQNFVGTLFIFSGFVKAVDPMGTSIKMHEYFEAMHLEFFNPISTPLTIAMLVAELTLGVALLVGWKPKISTSLLLLLNIFFLLLTGYTYLSGYDPTNLFFIVSILTFLIISAGAIIEKGSVRFWLVSVGFLMVLVSLALMKTTHILLTHPFEISKMKVTDCGCFGDFIKLKPWETFYKDVILTFMAFFLTLSYKNIRPMLGPMLCNVKTYAMLVLSLVFCLYNVYWNEPVIDFRPYAIGNDLNVMRTVLKPEKRETIMVFTDKKTGEVKEYKMDDYMKLGDAGWAKLSEGYVASQKSNILDEGIPARITNLSIHDEDGREITDSLLHLPDYTLLVVSPHLSNTNTDSYKNELNAIAAGCDKVHVKMLAMTSESWDSIEAFRHKYQTAYPFLTADETPLKTMMRSNPGLMLLKKGVVINKWHHKKLPTFEQLNTMYFKK